MIIHFTNLRKLLCVFTVYLFLTACLIAAPIVHHNARVVSSEELTTSDLEVMALVTKEVGGGTSKTSRKQRVTAILGHGSFAPQTSETSPIITALWHRNSPLTQPAQARRFQDVEITSMQLLADDPTSASRSYVCLWLPAYSTNGREAIVYAWSYWSTEPYLAGEGDYWFLERRNDKWVIVRRVQQWIT